MQAKPDKRLLSIHSQTEGVTWPPLMQGMGATLAALLHELEESQWHTAEKLLEKQMEQLAELAQHAARHSPYFAQRLASARLAPEELNSLENLKRLPPMTRRDIQQAGASLFCSSMPESHRPVAEAKTSGSTGEPVTVRKTEVSKLFWMANTMRDHFWHSRDFSTRLFATRANVEPSSKQGWGLPVGLLFKSGPTRFISSLTDVREQLREIRGFRPGGLLIYPSTLAGLLAECEKQNEHLSLKFIWCFGETLSPGLRTKAETFFGVPIRENYSSVELGIIAVQCPESGWFHSMSESVLVEVLDEWGNPCGENETGKVVVTDLHNFATPLIRYAIGDYAEQGGSCPCGRGLPTVKRIIGRERNLVKKPDGSSGWPEIGFKQFRDIAPIHQFQFIQHDLEHIEARFAAGRPLTSGEEEALRGAIVGALQHPFTISFTYFEDSIPKGPNGKFEEFVCRAA